MSEPDKTDFRPTPDDDATLAATAGSRPPARRPPEPAPLPADAEVGPFRILEVLGAGGMGFVYRARQRSPDRDVALKVIRGDAFSPGLLRRFEYEIEVLGQLDHPGIARIHAAGTHEDASGRQPYFAMELVDGVDLLRHCERQGLSPRERVALVAEVCDAIEHAHRRGVIHRDLKPSNILVASDGHPKVLDFGIARASTPDPTHTRRTMTGQLIGTLPYMSPEQLDGNPAVIDLRCDVYALGVVLYETLSGRLPHDVGDRSVLDAARLIRDTEPTRLRRHDPTFGGDLETIALKALEKDPDRRYRDAAALADDLRRFLDSRPITARPASMPDRIVKFTRRNRILVVGTAATALALVAGIIASTAFALDANAERRATEDALDFQSRMLSGIEPHRMGRGILDRLRAHVERTDADGLADFDAAVSGVNHADLARGVLEENVLARAADALDRDYGDRPRLERSLRESLGEVATQLGLHGRARIEFERAAALVEAEQGPRAPAFARALNHAALVAMWDGDAGGARVLVDRVKAARGDRLRGDDPESIETRLIDIYLRLAAMRAPAPDVAADTVASYEELFQVIERSRTVAPRTRAVATVELGRAYDFASRTEEALESLRDGIEQCDVVFGPDHVYTMLARSGAVNLLIEDGRHAEAEPFAEALLEHQRRTMGEENLFTQVTIDLLARIYSRVGRTAEAETLYHETIETSTRMLGERHDSTLVSRTNLAKCIGEQGRWDEAGELYAETLATARRLPPNLMAVAMNAQGLGRARLELEDLEGAETELRRSIATFRLMGMARSSYAIRSMGFLADVLERAGRDEEAAQWRERQADGTES